MAKRHASYRSTHMKLVSVPHEGEPRPAGPAAANQGAVWCCEAVLVLLRAVQVENPARQNCVLIA